MAVTTHSLEDPLRQLRETVTGRVIEPGDEDYDAARTVIERQVAHIARLVEDLVDSARIERGTLSLQQEPLDLRDVLRTAVDMAHQTLTFVPQGQPLIVPPSGPLAAIHPRHWTVEGDVLRLRGRTDRFESIDAVTRALATSASLHDVVAEDSRAAVDGNGIEFRVRATWRPALGAPS